MFPRAYFPRAYFPRAYFPITGSGAIPSGSAAGTSTATAVGRALVTATGSASGTSTATAPGSGAFPPAPSYPDTELRINGTLQDMLYDWNIQLTQNGRSRFDCRICSIDGSYRPAIDEEVIVYFNTFRIFGGFIDNPVEAGAVDEGGIPIVTSVSAADYNQLAERRYPEEVIPSGSLLSFLLRIVPWLEGVTLDPLQVTGPTLPAKTYDAVMTRDILDDLTLLSGGYVWEIDVNQTLRMYLPGTLAAPFNITGTPNKAIGDVKVELKREGYANNIITRNATLRGQANNTIEQFAHGIWSLVVTAPDTTDQAGMDALAAMILARSLPIQKKVKYLTRDHGLRPGMTQTITVANRNVNNIFLITDVSIYGSEFGLVYEVTALEGLVYQTGWQQTYKQWSSGSGMTVAGGAGGGGTLYTRYAYYLGGDGVMAVQSPTPTWVPATGGVIGQGAIQVQINTIPRGTTLATVIARLRALDSGVSVQARLYDVTAAAPVSGASAVVTSTTWQTVAFGVSLTPGSHFYELQLLPGTANADVMGTAYLE